MTVVLYRPSLDARSGAGQLLEMQWRGLSAAGIPALICYCAVLLYSIRVPHRISRDGPKELHSFTKAHMLALVIYAIASTFGNHAYTTYLPALAGLSAAIDDLAQRLQSTRPDPQVA